MKIEAGKFYKTREGIKAEIIATNGRRPDYPLVGYIGTRTIFCVWTEEGKFDLFVNKHFHDLVAEWEEPKPRKLAWAHIHGSLVLLDEGKLPANKDNPYWTRVPHLDEPKNTLTSESE